MGQLAERIAHLLRAHGLDPAARQGELHALASLEEREPKQALARFHDMKRALLVERRAEILAALRRFPFVADVPTSDATGYDLKEVEREIRDAARALRHAREIEGALADEGEARATLRHRALAPRAPLASAPWEALAALVDEAEALRRAARHEARIEERARDVARRARKLEHGKVATPDPRTADDATLEQAERALAVAESLEAAHADALAPLRDPAVREWRRESARAIEREIKAALTSAAEDALRSLATRAAALREEAAREAGKAARARRSGTRAPDRERRASDTMDGYG